MGRAFGNIGNAYSASGFFEQVRTYGNLIMNINETQFLKETWLQKKRFQRVYCTSRTKIEVFFSPSQAIKYHKQELTISKEVNDRASEAATHGNLAVAYQALEMHDIAMVHYHSHLNLARELKDTAGTQLILDRIIPYKGHSQPVKS